MRPTALKRHNDYRKALRKQNIARCICGDYYNHLHQYSKNKIHCSCPLCSSKTRGGNWSISDLRKLQRMEIAI